MATSRGILVNPKTSFDPARPDFAPYGFTCGRWAPKAMLRPDRHNEIELNFLSSGWLTYLFGGSKVRVEAGRLSAFWAAIPHQVIDFGHEPEYYVATIPLAWFLQCKLPDQLVQPLLHGQMISAPHSAGSWLDREYLAQWESDLQGGGGSPPPKAALMEMEARLLRLALACPDWTAPTPSSQKRKIAVREGGLTKAEEMACFIAQRYCGPLTVDVIAEAVDLHPNYAMNLFHRVFGTTLVGYVTQHRLSHAQRLLVTTDMKIVDVADSSGFSSLSRFNEAFRRAFGCSPRAYRHQHVGDTGDSR